MHDDFDGFRLPKSVSSVADLYRCETESIASSATSKNRIDMLFSDTRSLTSDYNAQGKSYDYHRKVKSMVDGHGGDSIDEYYDDTKPTAKNDVQVRIEKMFSEVSSSEQEADNSLMNNKFSVTHLGSMPVECKITSVDGLQEPLKELYFKYCAQRRRHSTGFIQISEKGLLIEYNGHYGGRVEKLNPFSTIAIWASLKFSCRRTEDGYEYAFLPIVSNTDKNSLYQRLDDSTAANFKGRDNSPLFVVVMREPDTLTKQLVCHGFVCSSSEDAVIIATTLYRVLMSKLGRNRVLKDKNQRRRMKPLPNKLSSIGETSANEVNESEFSYSAVMKTSPPPPPPPPPLPPLPPTRPPRKAKEVSKLFKKDDGKTQETPKVAEIGDVLTKVAIPRSSSFLNMNRLGTRYDNNKPFEQLQKMSVSPLGFMEMFNELQSQEGLKTVDEILNVIIRAEGMSFNELKPIYKEFLLKLALVLSKDELYNRSKSIMNLQNKKHRPSKLRKVITTKSGLKNVLRKPLVKLKANKTTASCSCRKTTNSKIYSDCTSTDSFFLTDKPKPEAKLRPAKNLTRHKSFRFRTQRITSTSEDSDYPNINNHRKFKANKIKDDALRPSSSGYFSFSECSYDTESCTCTSADKCYCSLSKDKMAKKSKTLRTNYSVCSCTTLECRKRNKCYCGTKTKNLSLVEQLKQKGFAVSESSLSPDETTQKLSVKEKSNTKLSKSLEYLENSKKYKNRMELYDSNKRIGYPSRHPSKYSMSYSSDSSRTSQKRSTSSDNLAVDYSMFAKPDDQRNLKDIYKNNYKRTISKQGVVYAELACPQIVPGGAFNRNYSIPPVLSRGESPSLMAIYPHHAPIRACNCACTCPMFTGEAFPSFHNSSRLGSTPFHRINMENIFGYYP